MKAKNKYLHPIGEGLATHITDKSQAHRKFTTDRGITFDLTKAIDYICPEDTPIRAAFTGKIVYVSDKVVNNYNKVESLDKVPISELDGNTVMIKHPNGEFSLYSHMKHGKVNVKLGEQIKKGDVIGNVGNTGFSFRPHLHFMVFKCPKLPQSSPDMTDITFEDKISVEVLGDLEY